MTDNRARWFGFRLTYNYIVHILINFDSNITPKIPSNWQNKLLRRRPLLMRRRSEKIGHEWKNNVRSIDSDAQFYR
jgi:hypothetical protein